MTHRAHLTAIVVITGASLLISGPDAHAGWTPSGIPVCSAPYSQLWTSVAPGEDGSTLIAWNDDRNAPDDAVFAQQLDSDGDPVWPVGGALVAWLPPFSQGDPVIASDGAGGGIIAYHKEGLVYAQRLDPTGNPLWPATGVQVTSQTGLTASVVADASGGAYVVVAGAYRLFVQHVDGDGSIMWGVDGVDVSSVTGTPGATALSDGNGGVMVMWFTLSGRARAQRFDGSGNALWGNAKYLSTTDFRGELWELTSIPDGAGGMLVVWLNYYGYVAQVYAQRVTTTGSLPWGWDPVGVAIYPDADVTGWIGIAPDGGGGAFVTWSDKRAGLVGVYGQRLGATGASAWTQGGIPLTPAVNAGISSIASDGGGGAIITWLDSRNGPWEVRAQRVDADGTHLWQEDSIIGTAQMPPYTPGLVADGHGGVVTVWCDGPTNNLDVFAQRIEGRYGQWGRPAPRLDRVEDVPNDEGGQVSVQWTASDRDALPLQAITHYSVWRAVDAQAFATIQRMSPSAVMETPLIEAGFSGPAYYAEHIATTTYYWEFIGNQAAMTFEGYVFNAPTTTDSSAAGPALHHFQVLAHTSDPLLYWPSEAVDGYSVDNSLATGVGSSTPPTGIALRANIPNPFTTTTRLLIGLSASSDVTVEIYDVVGRRVRRIVSMNVPAGEHSVSFDGRDDMARLLPSGVYFYRVTAGGKTATNRMVIAR